MSTKLNRKASQEPESWCFSCSASNFQEPILETKITPSKSQKLFPLTNPRLPALSISPNKAITTGNKESHPEIKNHELAQLKTYFTPQSPASNFPIIQSISTNFTQSKQNQSTVNHILIPKLESINYSQRLSQYFQIIPNLNVTNLSNLANSSSLPKLNHHASSTISNCPTNHPQFDSTPLQIPLYQPALDPERALPNAPESEQCSQFNLNFNLSHLQELQELQELQDLNSSLPERALPNALATESESSSTNISPHQTLINPFNPLNLSPSQDLDLTQQLSNNLPITTCYRPNV